MSKLIFLNLFLILTMSYKNYLTDYEAVQPPEGFEDMVEYSMPSIRDDFPQLLAHRGQSAADFDLTGQSRISTESLSDEDSFKLVYPEVQQTISPIPQPQGTLYIPQDTVAPSYTGPVNALAKIDIEDLLKSEGITSINGKKIKFGKRSRRPANASYGVKNSHHKEIDPLTGFANARDISITDGKKEDYALFKKILLTNSRVCAWMSAKKWGIINEITPEALKKTNGTGNHFHFGPDQWAVRTWNYWLKNPNCDVALIIHNYRK